VALSDAEVIAVYDCLQPQMAVAYAASGADIAVHFNSYRLYSNHPYVSATHGERYVMNYANDTARAYGLFEKAGALPVGSKLAKPSFSVKGNGQATMGPLFTMEKMDAGFNPDSGDWRYSMVLPSGSVVGSTNGKGADKVEFCIGCHLSVTPEQDSIMLIPEEYRVK